MTARTGLRIVAVCAAAGVLAAVAFDVIAVVREGEL